MALFKAGFFGGNSSRLVTDNATYELQHNIGEGSMGAVYLANVVSSKIGEMPKQVAIKVLNTDARPGGTDYRREISLMRDIRHPNIVRVYDWCFDDDNMFAVFEYHSRGSVADLFYRDGPLPQAMVQELMTDILKALVALHRAGVLHLDIKPGNILIGESGNYLLTDFGVATTLFTGGEKRVVGTPAYMAPEQARGRIADLDARTDLFALGVTMWQLIQGRFPFKNVSSMKVMQSRFTEPLPQLSPLVEPPFKPVAQIIDHLLSFDPRTRPGSAAEVLASLEGLTMDEGEPDHETGKRVGPKIRQFLRQKLTDPVLLDLLRKWGKHYRLREYAKGEVICREGEKSFDVYIILDGAVEVSRAGQVLEIEEGEGIVLGEVAALIGSSRTAMLKAHKPTILALLKAAELEQAAKVMPALAVRLMKGLAMRLEQITSTRH